MIFRCGVTMFLVVMVMMVMAKDFLLHNICSALSVVPPRLLNYPYDKATSSWNFFEHSPTIRRVQTKLNMNSATSEAFNVNEEVQILSFSESSSSTLEAIAYDDDNTNNNEARANMFEEIVECMRHLSKMERWTKKPKVCSSLSIKKRRANMSGMLREYLHQDVASPIQDAMLVESLLHRIIQLHDIMTNEESKMIVNTEMFNMAIEAWSNINTHSSAQNAEAILEQIMDNNSQYTSQGPNIWSFCYCFTAWFQLALTEKQAGNEDLSSNAMEKAQSILEKMKYFFCINTSENNVLNNDLEDVLEQWSKKNNSNFAEMSEYFLSFLEQMVKSESAILQLTVSMYNHVMTAWIRAGNSDSCDRAEAILKRMETSTQGGAAAAATVLPTRVSYTTVIAAWSNSGRPNSVFKAEQIHQSMINSYENGNINAKPDTISYNALLNAFAKSSTEKETSDKAMAIFQEMINLSKTKNDEKNLDVRPNVRSFNLMIGLLARDKGADHAEEFLKQMETMYDSADTMVRPDTVSFTTVIDAWARERNMSRAYSVLKWMEKSYQQGNTNARPTGRTYTSLLNAISKSGQKDSTERAEKILEQMESLYHAGNDDMKPDTRTYNAIIHTLANGKQKTTALKAEKLLSRMEKMHEAGDEAVKPDVFTYSTIINAWSKSGEKEGPKRAEALLGRMEEFGVEPSAHAFNAAIAAWSRSGSKGAAQKAEELMKRMEELYEAGNMNVKPDSFTFTSVIDGWAKSDEPGSALRAEVLLKLMEVMHKKGNKALAPTVQTFSSVINAWAKSGGKDAGEHAEKLVERMEKLYEAGNARVKPNTVTYTAAIDAYARCGARGAAEKADKLLRRMEQLFERGDTDVKPNVRTYNSAINAWSKSGQMGAVQKAESILRRMESRYKAGDKQVKPTVITYSSCINACVHSPDSGKAEKAYKLLRNMESRYGESGGKDKDIRPNVVAYTSVINACALCCGNDSEKERALEIARMTFAELDESNYGKPNHVTYAALIKSFSRLEKDDRKKIKAIASTFRRCCDDGQVDNSVLHQLRTSSSELFQTIVSKTRGTDQIRVDSISINDLPSDWCRNVASSRQRKLDNKMKHSKSRSAPS